MSSIDDYMQARGYKPLHPESKVEEEVLPIIEPGKESRLKKYSINAALALIASGLIFGTYHNLTKEVDKKSIIPIENNKPEIVYKYKTIYKYIDSPPEIIYKYIKDPAYDLRLAELEHNYRRRARMLKEFYTKPLKPGYKRQLTFESSCPGFDNSPERVKNLQY